MFDFIQIFSKSDKFNLLLLLILFVVSGIIEVIGIASVAPFIALLTKPEFVVDNYIYIKLVNIFNLSTVDATIVVGVLVIILFAVSNIITGYTLWKTVQFTASQQHKISMTVIKKYLYQPYNFYLKNNASLISKNILHETGVICDLVILPALQFISKSIIILSVSVFLLFVNYQIFITTVLILGLIYILIYSNIRSTIEDYGKTKITMNKRKYKYVNDAFSDIKNVKFYSAEESFLKLLDNPTKQFSFLTAKTTLLSILPRYILEVIAFGGIFSVLIYFLSKNYNILEQSPIIGVFIIAAYRILPLLQHIYQNFTIFKFNSPVTKIIKDIYMLSEIKIHKYNDIQFNKNIILKNISFSYNNNIILKNINLTIRKSNTIALIGESGQGKTTLIDILLGFHSNYKGEIILDDKVLKTKDILNLRKIIGYVSQDMNLTNITLKENIAFGEKIKDIDIKNLNQVIAISELDDFVNTLDNNTDTLLSERGMNISGGQKQRILIARALYRKPKILILDESTNALNEELEYKIINNIKNNFPEITIILITHRQSLLNFCDNVLELSDIGIEDNINNFRKNI